MSVLIRWMRFLVDWLPRTLLPPCVVIYSRVVRPATTAGSLLTIKMLTHRTLCSGYGWPGILLVSVADPGCLSRMRIFPSRIQGQEDSGSGSALKNFIIFLNIIRNGHPGSGSWFLPIPDPGSRGQKGTRSRILDPDPQHCFWCKFEIQIHINWFFLPYASKSGSRTSEKCSVFLRNQQNR